MTAIVRHPTVTITWLDTGGPVTITRVLAAHTALGLDISVGEASFTLPEIGDLHGATYFSLVTITISAGGTTQLWEGIITDLGFAYYPREVTVTCKGLLALADLTDMKDATPGAGTATPTGGLLLVPTSGAGLEDESIILNVLAACGITSPVSISGTAQKLGRVAPQSFIWSDQESGLSVIQRLDEVCAFQSGGVGPWLGFRTYDDVGGLVRRSLIDTIPGGTPAYIFSEGVDIFVGSGQKSIIQAKNKISVTGYDAGNGGGPVNYTLAVGNSQIPTPPQYIALRMANPMIERQTQADSGTGISCEAVANRLLRSWNVTQERSTFTTPLDVPVAVGSTIAIATPSTVPERLGVVGGMWVQKVERDISTDGAFSMILTVVRGAS